MAQKVGGLVVEMSANVARLQRDFDKASNQARGVARKFSSIFKGVGLSIAAGLSVAGLTNLVKSSLDAADKIAKLSQAVGVSVEELSAYAHAAELSGVSLDTIGRSLGLLSKNMLSASEGTREAKEAFESLGVEIKSNDGTLRRSDAVMEDIANKFASMKDGSDKTALAMRVFGRSGAELIPMLNAGGDGLKKMKDEAERLGLVFDTKTAKAAEAVNDSFTRMKGQITGTTYQITFALIPALEKLVELYSAIPEGLGQGGFGGVELLAEQLATAASEVQNLKEKMAVAQIHGARQNVLDVYAEKLRMAENNLRRLQAVQSRKISREGQASAAPTLDGGPLTGGPADDTAAKVIAALRFEQEQINRLIKDGAVEQEIYNQLNKAGVDIKTAEGAAIANLVRELEAQKDAQEAAKEAAAAHSTALARQAVDSQILAEQAAALYRTLRSPREVFEEGVANLDYLRDEGFIDSETYSRAFNALGEEFSATVDGMKEKTSELSEFAREAFRSMQSSASDFFFDTMRGEMTNFGEDFAKMVQRMIADWAAMKLMNGLFGESFGSGGPLGGVLGKMSGFLSGGRAVGGTVTAGNSYVVGEMGPEIFTPQTAGNILATGKTGDTMINVPVSMQGDDKKLAARLQLAIERTVHEELRRSI